MKHRIECVEPHAYEILDSDDQIIMTFLTDDAARDLEEIELEYWDQIVTELNEKGLKNILNIYHSHLMKKRFK